MLLPPNNYAFTSAPPFSPLPDNNRNQMRPKTYNL